MQTTSSYNDSNCQIMLLVDCSSSLAPCFDKLQSTLENTYRTLCRHCDVGVAVYAEKFQKIASPASYRESISETLQNLKPAYNSNLCDALYSAADCFDLSVGGRKLIIVFTDGGFDGKAPYECARELECAGIEVHAIGFSGRFECLAENLQKLTGGAFARFCDCASYIDALFPYNQNNQNNQNCTSVPHCDPCVNVINIEACAPDFKGFCTVNVQISGSYTCGACALCVKLMLGRKIISEQYLLVESGGLPATVSFIVPEDMLSCECGSSQLCAQVFGNPIMC